MKWFLMIAIGSGYINGIDLKPAPMQIAMPPQEVCQQIAKLNGGVECWAKLESERTVPDGCLSLSGMPVKC